MKRKIYSADPLINDNSLIDELGVDNRILLPITMIKDDYNKTMYYILFNTLNKKFMKVKPKEIKQLKANGYDIRGFGSNNRPSQYFDKIKPLGTNDGYKRYLLWRISYASTKPYFMLVDEDGVIKSLNKEDMIKLAYKDDTIIIGAILDKDNKNFKVSKEIERSFNNEDLEKLSKTEKIEKITTELDDNIEIANGIIMVSAKS